MPVIFLAFGFILNRWEREEGWFKWVKIPLIIVAAFVFDALLSYEICEKIYNLHTQMSLAELPEYSFALASKDPKFWIIICLGFVSYLIWGLTFGYFVKSLDQLDLNRILEEKLRNDIETIKGKIVESQDKQHETAKKKADVKAEIQKLENQIHQPDRPHQSLCQHLSGHQVNQQNSVKIQHFHIRLQDRQQQKNL